jgi:hypothetical protein
MSFRKAAQAYGRLELELNEERAAALHRIGQTLESLIEQLNVLRERIGTVHWADASPDLARFRELRRQAVRHLSIDDDVAQGAAVPSPTPTSPFLITRYSRYFSCMR